MFHRILVGFDGSPAARGALRFAAFLAATDAEVTVATVAVERLETGFATGIDAFLGQPAADQVLLGEARSILGARDGVTYEAAVGASVGVVLRRLADEHDCDLVVVGSSRHHGLRRSVAGSDAEDTLHGTPCAVCVVPTAPPAALRLVGAAFDGSRSSRSAGDAAARIATSAGVPCEVLAVVDTEHPFVAGRPGADLHHDGRRLLDEEVARLALPDVPPRSVLAHGDPGDWLVHRTRRLDLLVLGGHPQGAAHRLLLGSVGDDVVRRAHCPVLVVPEVARTREPVGVAAPVRRGVSW